MVKKDTLIIVNKIYLLQMIPTFYQTHLENQLAPFEYLLLCILIDVLQNIKEVILKKLAKLYLCQSNLKVNGKNYKDFYHYLRLILKKCGYQLLIIGWLKILRMVKLSIW